MNANNPDSPRPTPPDAERAAAGAAKSDDIVVFITRREGACAECGEEFFRGQMIRVEKNQPLCLDCADLGHLEYLPRGDTALTRRASKHSPLRAVVVEWSRSRKGYERQGILVTPASILRAEKECLADADARERQRERAAARREAVETTYLADVTAAIRAQYPGCPPAETGEIAEWACQKHSGRVGRSAAAKGFDPQALRLAVIAHIRHQHTRYDHLLMQCGDRELARQTVRADIERVLERWESPRAG